MAAGELILLALMIEPSNPVNSHDSIAASLASELLTQLQSAAFSDTKSIVIWYMRSGISRGVARASLVFALREMPEIQSLACELTSDELAQGKPLPEFTEGQKVEVVLNARNLNYHAGVIASRTWHNKEQMWMYQIIENGRRVSKQYEARDLRPNEAKFLYNSQSVQPMQKSRF